MAFQHLVCQPLYGKANLLTVENRLQRKIFGKSNDSKSLCKPNNRAIYIIVHLRQTFSKRHTYITYKSNADIKKAAYRGLICFLNEILLYAYYQINKINLI